MIKTYAFDSVNGDRKYNADDVAQDKANFFSNGVVVQGGNTITTQLLVEKLDGLKVKVNDGVALINGRTFELKDTGDGDNILTTAAGHPTLKRYDVVALELNLNDDVRDIKLKIIQGVPSDNPEVPELVRTDKIYQLFLARISIYANTSSITNIYDYRSSESRCGIANVKIGITPPSGNDASAVILSNATALKYGYTNTSVNKLTVENAVMRNLPISSYLSFVANASEAEVASAFGCFNEELVGNIGMQLVMFDRRYNFGAYNKFPNLSNKNLYNEVVTDLYALKDIFSSTNRILGDFIYSNPYAYGKLTYALSSDLTRYKNLLELLTGYTVNTFSTIDAMLTDATAVGRILDNSQARAVLFVNQAYCQKYASPTETTSVLYNAMLSRAKEITFTTRTSVNIGRCFAFKGQSAKNNTNNINYTPTYTKTDGNIVGTQISVDTTLNVWCNAVIYHGNPSLSVSTSGKVNYFEI